MQRRHKADLGLTSAVIPSPVTDHHCKLVGKKVHQQDAEHHWRTTLKEAEVTTVLKLGTDTQSSSSPASCPQTVAMNSWWEKNNSRTSTEKASLKRSASLQPLSAWGNSWPTWFLPCLPRYLSSLPLNPYENIHCSHGCADRSGAPAVTSGCWQNFMGLFQFSGYTVWPAPTLQETGSQLQLKQVLPATFTSGNFGRGQKLGLGDLPGRWKCQRHGSTNRLQLPWPASVCNVLLQPLLPTPGVWLPVLKVSSDTAQSRFGQCPTPEQPDTELKRKPVDYTRYLLPRCVLGPSKQKFTCSCKTTFPEPGKQTQIFSDTAQNRKFNCQWRQLTPGLAFLYSSNSDQSYMHILTTWGINCTLACAKLCQKVIQITWAWHSLGKSQDLNFNPHSACHMALGKSHHLSMLIYCQLLQFDSDACDSWHFILRLGSWRLIITCETQASK